MAALPSCVTSSPLPEPEPGAFTGSVLVMWVGEGGRSGDGRFLFVPDPRNPLTFRRPGGRQATAIRPEMMYTDGGSIPRVAQIFNGLSPWGYAPAYMIHDWLFVARHCRRDGDGDPAYAGAGDLSFRDSYQVLDEAIATLVAERKVARNDVARSAITAAVASPVARRLWDQSGACAGEKVRPEDAAAAEAAIPGSGRRPSMAAGPPADGGVTAVVVGQVGF
ncbi:conserved hypothetical protein [uncultured Pleomorphomonas sp.]|uniref:DUF1353 domain-containing protein n=1 Tax=uncultured Pleomorphomonas sp. TaxID=442121 RepID=A0A212LP08_9HYPH|nr:hypothetical protein [uncultured Pleomorphomonas sp.]SCM79254.1 conserved hypothetical protein [uncultured Pleomorphomonas sp.]